MRAIRSSTAAAATRRHHVLPNGTGFWKTNFHMPAPDPDAVQPQSFLVEQEPNSVILPHFHEQNQFQVIVRGSGALGKHQVGAVSVHYASAHTPYGPITAEGEGLWYFTLRDGFDPGARFMPESRDLLRRARRRFLLIGDVAVGDEVARAAPAVEPVVEPQADGLAAWILRLGSGQSAAAADPAGGGGQYLLVLAGGMRAEDEELPPRSCIFVPREDAPAPVVAGAGGLTLLALQFPRRDAGSVATPPG